MFNFNFLDTCSIAQTASISQSILVPYAGVSYYINLLRCGRKVHDRLHCDTKYHFLCLSLISDFISIPLFSLHLPPHLYLRPSPHLNLNLTHYLHFSHSSSRRGCHRLDVYHSGSHQDDIRCCRSQQTVSAKPSTDDK